MSAACAEDLQKKLQEKYESVYDRYVTHAIKLTIAACADADIATPKDYDSAHAFYESYVLNETVTNAIITQEKEVLEGVRSSPSMTFYTSLHDIFKNRKLSLYDRKEKHIHALEVLHGDMHPALVEGTAAQHDASTTCKMEVEEQERGTKRSSSSAQDLPESTDVSARQNASA